VKRFDETLAALPRRLAERLCLSGSGRVPFYPLLIVLGAGALVVTLAKIGRPDPAQRPVPSSSLPRSEIYTTAHRSALDAVEDFFGYRPTPTQPIAYSHQVHLASGMQCVNCHAGADTGPDASLPSVRLCMTCHLAIAADKPEIKKMAAYVERGEDIPWQRVYGYPDYSHVRFDHAPHVRAGVDCKACHGDMARQTAAVRSIDLHMGFCLDCHKQRKASIDCAVCHF